MDAWLRQVLCETFKIFANAEFPFPRAIVDSVFETILGSSYANAPKLETDALTFQLFHALPNYLDKNEFQELAAYVEGDSKGSKRFQLCAKIAHVFDQYAVYRPEMVAAWENEAQVTDQTWQAMLWNDLIRDTKLVYAGQGFNKFARALKEEKNLAELPPRISVFGVSTLPPLYLNVLQALSEHSEVGLFLLSPSAQYWAHIQNHIEIKRAAKAKGLSTEQAMEDLHLEIGNPLLAKLGDTGRDFQQILDARYTDDHGEVELFSEPSSANLLGTIQADVFNLRDRKPDSEDEDAQSKAILAEDDSLSIHACHGAMREVEVMRDHIREALEADKSLRPHDIVVMVPDFDTYAPLIEAAFSAHHRKTPEIPYSISDRSARDNAPVIQAFLDVLALSRRRLSVAEVLDLLSLQPVREKFNILAADVEHIREWMVELRVRWGRDRAHRADENQPELDQNTWWGGLNRLLLGYAYSKDSADYFADVLPYTDLKDEHWELLGRFCRFVDRLFLHLKAFDQPCDVSTWGLKLQTALEDLASSRGKLAKQHQFIRSTIQTLLQATEGSDLKEDLDLDIIRSFFDTKLEPSERNAGDLSGGVVFCAMLPMRSIPFRIVGLMGLNDRDFPRDDRGQGFDLIRNSPKAGDRSTRKDDRYLFLEALLSAQERVIITYTGRGINRNETLPPSVVVSDILDTVRRGFYVAGANNDVQPGADVQTHRKSIEDRLVVRHRLQAFHQDYFDEQNAPRHFSYSQSNCEAAIVLRNGGQAPHPFLAINEELNIVKPEVVELDQLLRFWGHPPEYLVSQVLNLKFSRKSESIDDREPFTLTGLDVYALGDFILKDLAQKNHKDRIQQNVRSSGQLPLGVFGDFTFDKTHEEALILAQMIEAEAFEPFSDPIYVNINCPSGILTGALPKVGPTGILDFGFARLGSKQILKLWIKHLCLCATTKPVDIAHNSVHIGRGEKKQETARIRFGPVEDPAAILDTLIGFYLRGQSQALPFFPKSSYAYAKRIINPARYKDGRLKGDPPVDARKEADKQWEDQRQRGGKIKPGEWQNPAIQRLFGAEAPFDEDVSDFIKLAVTIFDPVLKNMEANS